MARVRLFVLMAVLAGAWLGATGCTWKSGREGIAASPEIVEASHRYRKEYVLAPGDGINVVILKHMDISMACVIRPDGYISLPMLDDVKAAGLTPMELDKRLTERFSRRLADPEVTVIATQIRPPSVFVVGEVRAPTVVLLQDAVTAAQAVARAGGFTNWAAERSVLVIRLREDDRLVAIKPFVTTWGQDAAYLALQNVRLQQDDIIFVPKTPIAQVSIFIDQNINTILGGVNSVLSTYNQIKLTQLLDDIVSGQ